MASFQPNVALRTFMCGQLLGALMEREFAAEGASRRDFAVLSVIGAKGPITPSNLAELLGMPPTTLSAVLNRLARSRQIRRRPNPADGRSVLLEVTAAGRRRWQKGIPALRRTLRQIDRELDRPTDDVIDALDALERAIRAALAI